ncbi:unnamed protein product, partial [Enterobius vermicularis]|uniref:Purple acid phosphatase n=1 Tax=Enterobius vermicularis TaxID=51028 RepID=A0A0N4V7Z2_ENTVE
SFFLGNGTDLYVTWITFDETFKSLVEYGENDLNLLAEGTSVYFVDEGEKRIRRYVHRVTLKSLKPGVTYQYHVGSEYGWSPIFRFTALEPRPEGGFIYAVYGDLGNVNARSLGKIQQFAQRGKIDMVLHIGDMAYNLDTDDGYFGDQFGRQIEPIAAYVPYMTVVGNHESAQNFSHYVNRFDIGPAHFIVISTEFYFYTNYGWKQIHHQWNWLMNDLQKANSERDKHPWIITMGHRPMYCSNFDGDDCTRYDSIVLPKCSLRYFNNNEINYTNSLTAINNFYVIKKYWRVKPVNLLIPSSFLQIRTGLPVTHAYGLEKLFYTYGVDLMIWAHEHSYERLWPVYNRTVFNGTRSPYFNPPAPVHIVTGSAGCQENTDPFQEHSPPWSAFRSSNYGFTTMQIFNDSHIYFEQIAASKEKPEDSFWLIKYSHRPYTLAQHKVLEKYGTHIPY